MPRHNETNKVPYQLDPEIPSPDPNRPPQLNETVNGCGCQCGARGLGNEGDGGSNDDDGATLVATSEYSASEDGFPPSSDGPEEHVSVGNFQSSVLQDSRQRNEIPTRFGVFEIRPEGFRMPRHMFHRLGPVQVVQDEMADSMKNEPGDSDERSVVPTDVGTISRRSPGPGITGIGDWATEELQLKDYHFDEFHFIGGRDYHFLIRPLRLTPQLRYCRGLVTSHMVVPDDDFHGFGE